MKTLKRCSASKISALLVSVLSLVASSCTTVERSATALGESSNNSSTNTGHQPSRADEKQVPVTLLPPGPQFGASADASVTSSSTEGSSQRPKTPEHIAVVGDSLTVASQDLIAKALRSAGTSEVTIDGVEGRRMTGRSPGRPPGSDAIRNILDAGHTPDLWVIELGTNDVGAQVHPEEFRADMESIISLLPVGATIVWVNIYVRDREDATDQANAIIGSVATTHPNMSVANWNSLATDEPDLITADGIHLRQAGAVGYALMIANAVSSAYAQPSETSTSAS